MLVERKETSKVQRYDKKKLHEQKFPTPAKHKGELPWLKEVDSLALANAQVNLQKAYQETSLKGMPNFQGSSIASQNSLIRPIE